MTTLISFYTNDWKYPQHAERLKAECESFGVPYKIEQLKSTGSYLKNTCLKPQFILDCLNDLKSPVLWVDVDASLLGKPETPIKRNYVDVFDGYEIKSVEVLGELPDFAAKRMSEERDRTWHVGTMWFNYKPNVIEFLEKWIANTGNLSDESALEKTWQDDGWMLDTFDLPKEYFYIERISQEPPEGTVIMHRISDSNMKKREMRTAKIKRDRGVW